MILRVATLLLTLGTLTRPAFGCVDEDGGVSHCFPDTIPIPDTGTHSLHYRSDRRSVRSRLGVPATPTVDIYVSSTVNATQGSGTEQDPFGSLIRASLAAVNAASQPGHPRVTVHLSRGVHTAWQDGSSEWVIAAPNTTFVGAGSSLGGGPVTEVRCAVANSSNPRTTLIYAPQLSASTVFTSLDVRWCGFFIVASGSTGLAVRDVTIDGTGHPLQATNAFGTVFEDVRWNGGSPRGRVSAVGVEYRDHRVSFDPTPPPSDVMVRFTRFVVQNVDLDGSDGAAQGTERLNLMYFRGSVVMDTCTVRGNVVAGVRGGDSQSNLIYSSSAFLMTDSVVQDNVNGAGAIFVTVTNPSSQCYFCKVAVRRTTFERNRAAGGTVSIMSFSSITRLGSTFASVSVEDTRFLGNVNGDTGAVTISMQTPRFARCVFYGNSISASQGGYESVPKTASDVVVSSLPQLFVGDTAVFDQCVFDDGLSYSSGRGLVSQAPSSLVYIDLASDPLFHDCTFAISAVRVTVTAAGASRPTFNASRFLTYPMEHSVTPPGFPPVKRGLTLDALVFLVIAGAQPEITHCQVDMTGVYKLTVSGQTLGRPTFMVARSVSMPVVAFTTVRLGRVDPGHVSSCGEMSVMDSTGLEPMGLDARDTASPQVFGCTFEANAAHSVLAMVGAPKLSTPSVCHGEDSTQGLNHLCASFTQSSVEFFDNVIRGTFDSSPIAVSSGVPVRVGVTFDAVSVTPTCWYIYSHFSDNGDAFSLPLVLTYSNITLDEVVVVPADNSKGIPPAPPTRNGTAMVVNRGEYVLNRPYRARYDDVVTVRIYNSVFERNGTIAAGREGQVLAASVTATADTVFDVRNTTVLVGDTVDGSHGGISFVSMVGLPVDDGTARPTRTQGDMAGFSGNQSVALTGTPVLPDTVSVVHACSEGDQLCGNQSTMPRLSVELRYPELVISRATPAVDIGPVRPTLGVGFRFYIDETLSGVTFEFSPVPGTVLPPSGVQRYTVVVQYAYDTVGDEPHIRRYLDQMDTGDGRPSWRFPSGANGSVTVPVDFSLEGFERPNTFLLLVIGTETGDGVGPHPINQPMHVAMAVAPRQLSVSPESSNAFASTSMWGLTTTSTSVLLTLEMRDDFGQQQPARNFPHTEVRLTRGGSDSDDGGDPGHVRSAMERTLDMDALYTFGTTPAGVWTIELRDLKRDSDGDGQPDPFTKIGTLRVVWEGWLYIVGTAVFIVLIVVVALLVHRRWAIKHKTLMRVAEHQEMRLIEYEEWERAMNASEVSELSWDAESLIELTEGQSGTGPDGGGVPIFRFEEISAHLGPHNRLSRGGFGEVFRCKWHGSMVAVKRAFVEGSPSRVAKIRAAFEEEVRMLHRISHPNILGVYGACLDPPDLCFISELMERGSLYRVLHNDTERKGLHLPRRVDVCMRVAMAMRYLHDLSPPIIHRDLKSTNVLLAKDYRVALADFGLARSMMGSELETKNGAAGTPAWMAPEVLRSEAVTRKADVFSFGVVMWEVLTGEVPWKGKAYVDIVRDVGINGERLDVTRVVVTPSGVPVDEAEAALQLQEGQYRRVNGNRNPNNDDAGAHVCVDVNDAGGNDAAPSSHGHLLTETLGTGGGNTLSGRATLTASTAETREQVLASEVITATVPPSAQRTARSQCAVLIGECFRADPSARPSFAEIAERLERIRDQIFEHATFHEQSVNGHHQQQQRPPPPLAQASALETKSAADSLTDYDFDHDSRQPLI